MKGCKTQQSRFSRKIKSQVVLAIYLSTFERNDKIEPLALIQVSSLIQVSFFLTKNQRITIKNSLFLLLIGKSISNGK